MVAFQKQLHDITGCHSNMKCQFYVTRESSSQETVEQGVKGMAKMFDEFNMVSHIVLLYCICLNVKTV